MIRQLALLTVLLACLLAGLQASNGVEFKPSSGSSVFGGVVGILPEGGVNCIGGEPTGVWPACSSGTIRSVIRGVLLLHYQTSMDSPFSGIRISVLNANLDAEGEGPMWGTWELEIDSPDWGCTVGSCRTEGTYTGKLAPLDTEWEVTGHGTEGIVEGMKIHLTGTADPFLNEEFDGYFFQPLGN